MKKAKIVGAVGAILAAVFPIMSIFGVDVDLDDQAKIIAGITSLVGIIAANLGESPVQDKIQKTRN